MRVATWYLPGTWYMVGHTIIVVGGRQAFYVLGTYYYAGIQSFLLCKPTIRGIYPLAVDLSTLPTMVPGTFEPSTQASSVLCMGTVGPSLVGLVV